jgi:hypothetical protein
MRRIGHLDMPGGGQLVVDGDFAFVGHMEPPHGTTIIDISDPAKPKVVATIETPDGYSHTHKVRVVGDLMYTNVEQYNRHFLRRGAALTEARARLAATLGRAPSDAEAAAEIGMTEDDIPALDSANERGYGIGGFRVYDISNKSAPKLITHEKTFGFGVHRFDVDENYAYISTEVEGYLGNILVIYDMADPAKPNEVGRWWMPGQHLAGGENPPGRATRTASITPCASATSCGRPSGTPGSGFSTSATSPSPPRSPPTTTTRRSPNPPTPSCPWPRPSAGAASPSPWTRNTATCRAGCTASCGSSTLPISTISSPCRSST